MRERQSVLHFGGRVRLPSTGFLLLARQSESMPWQGFSQFIGRQPLMAVNPAFPAPRALIAAGQSVALSAFATRHSIPETQVQSVLHVARAALQFDIKHRLHAAIVAPSVGS
jgi:hypothetical protein